MKHGEGPRKSGAAHEAGMAAKFACVGLVGFATDASILHLGLHFGLQPAWARLVSLICAMQVTFTINGLLVFRCLRRARFVRQWVGYMATNGFGNFCNYWIFVTLVSLHWKVVSAPMFALTMGSGVAYWINYLGTRFVAFAEKDVAFLRRLKRENWKVDAVQSPPRAPCDPMESSDPKRL